MFTVFRTKKLRHKTHNETRRPTKPRRLLAELLEERRLLSHVVWGNSQGGNWDVPGNWIGGVLPAPGDDVVIDTAATITIQSGDAETVNSVTTGNNSTLSITGGSLVVATASTLGGTLSIAGGSVEFDASAVLNGPLSMTGGSLTASGSGAAVSAAGATSVSYASLYAENGGSISLPALLSYASNENTFEANGTGSVLNVSALTTLAQGSWGWSINATNGGEVHLSGLTSLTGSIGIDITDTGGSTILDGNLTSLDGVTVTLDGTDTAVANSWQQFTDGSLTVTGGSYTLPNLTDVDGSSLYAESGGSLALPALTNYAYSGGYPGTFEANGANSVLDVSALVTVTLQGYFASSWSVNAANGGEVNLGSLTSLNSGGISFTDTGNSTILDGSLTSLDGVTVTLDGTDAAVANSWQQFTDGSLTVTGGSYSLSNLTDVDGSNLYAESGGSISLPALMSYASNGTTFEADGTNSVLAVSSLTTVTQQGSWGWSVNATNGGEVDLSGLTSLTGGSGNWITDTGGSTILDGNLTILDGVTVTLDGTDAAVANSWQQFTDGSLTVTGGSYSLSNLTDVDGSNLYAESGGSISLPALTSYASNDTTFGADGTNSVLAVPSLSTVTQQGYWGWFISATNGGEVDLSGLTSLTSTNGIWITDTGGSTILDGSLTSLDGVSVTLDGTDAAVANSWQQFTDGSLTVTGDSYSLSNLTDVDGSSLYAESGGSLALPALTSYASNGTIFEADDTNSVLAVPSLSTVTQQGYWGWFISATNGGEVDLSGLTSLTSTNGIWITDTGNSTILDGSLTSLDGVSVTLDGTDAAVADSWQQFTDGNLTVTGGSYSLSNLTDVDASNLYAESGGSLALPALTSYASNGTTFEADGMNSVLAVPSLTTVTQQGYWGWTINATNGGEVDLSGLTSLTSANGISITDTGGSTILDGSLTSLDGVTVTLDGTDAAVANSWQQFTDGSLTVNDGSYSLPNLTDVDGSSLYAESGGSISLPALTSYASNGTTFEANGTNSVLAVSSLTTVTQQGYWGWSINATNGGEVDLSGLTSLTGTNGIWITDTGNSTILDGNLTSLDGVTATLDGTDAAVANSWQQFTDGSLTVTGGSYSLSNLTDVDGSSLYAESGGSISLPALTNYASNGTTFEADGTNSVLAVSSLTTVTQPGYWGWSINATNGGEVDLSGLTSLTSTNGIWITDTGGSTILDGSLASLDGVTVTSDGTDTQVANSWQQFTDGSLTLTGGSCVLPALSDLAGSTLSVGAGASLTLPDAANFSAGNSTVTVNAGGALEVDSQVMNVPSWGYGTTIDVPALPAGLTLVIAGGSLGGGTTFHVPAGDNVQLADGTYTGGVTFDVAAGATVDLTGGQSGTYGGTLTGSGAGTVQLTDGWVGPAGEGLTLDFPAGMFQWTGGGFECDQGDVTNLGVVNLAGAGWVYTDGTFENSGQIVQTAGDLALYSDAGSTATFQNDAGASYVLESDSGLSASSGTVVLDNAGTISKTAGTGVSILDITGQLSNTGTIEADSGTIALAPASITQISGGTLTGGTWNAMNGATLQFPGGTAITSSAASLALGGAGATISGIAGLNSNSGSFAITGGASFTTAGDFANSGSLTVGGGGTLNVAGNYTQTAAGTLNDQIAGAPASGLFGQLAVAGTAALDGGLNVTLADSFTPSTGQDFPLMTFADATGSFATLSGLSPYLTLSPTLTSLDLTTASLAELSTAIDVAPASAGVGQTATVSWTVTNLGASPADQSWSDGVYVSASSTWDSSATLLATVPVGSDSPLAPNASYTQSAQVTIPTSLTSGNYYLFVVADCQQQQTQTSRSDDVASQPITLTLPDLVVEPTIAAPSGGNVGQSVDVSWTDENIGTEAANGPWADDVYAATDSQGDNPVLLGTYTFGGSLAPGQSAPQSQPVTLPSTPGTYWLVVTADADGGVPEYSNAGNGTTVSASPIVVTYTPPTSTVNPLPAYETSTMFMVNWSGTDTGGPGIRGFSIYVSDNGGPFTPWLSGTQGTSAAFTGQDGHTYNFYSVATDNTGVVEATPTAAEATTLVDLTPPTSTVTALPAYETSTTFTVGWSGTDGQNGSGVAGYSIYESDNGGPFTLWQSATAQQTSATFSGQDGHTYGFYSVATDNAGNVEATPTAAQATTLVDATPPTSTVTALPAYETSTTFTVGWSGTDGQNGSGVAGYSIYESDNGGPFTLWQSATAQQTSATFSGQDGDTYGFYSVATDNAGNVEATPTAAQATTTIEIAPLVAVGNSGAVFVIRGAAPAVLAPNLTVTDPAGANLASATVAISGGLVDAGQERLAATTAGTNITASYNSAAGILTLAGLDTAADYQQALRTVTYVDTLGAAATLGGRTLTFSVTDAANATASAPAALTMVAPLPGDANLDGKVDVNDLSILLANWGRSGMTWSQGNFAGDPTVDILDLVILLSHFDLSVGPPVVSVGNLGAVTSTAGGAPVAVAPSLTLADQESHALTSATVAIGGGPLDAGAELLAATTAGTKITASYNTAAGILTLSGSDTLADYQQVLQSVTYVDTLTGTANLGDRTLTFAVGDGILTSASAAATVDVVALADGGFRGSPMAKAADASAAPRSGVAKDVSPPVVARVMARAGEKTSPLAYLAAYDQALQSQTSEDQTDDSDWLGGVANGVASGRRPVDAVMAAY